MKIPVVKIPSEDIQFIHLKECKNIEEMGRELARLMYTHCPFRFVDGFHKEYRKLKTDEKYRTKVGKTAPKRDLYTGEYR